jgi:predicted dehydrogenase
MSNYTPVKFGLVGCGTISSTHADALNSLPNAILTACCDIDEQKAHQFGNDRNISTEHIHSNLESLLRDREVEAVTVCTPSGIHTDIAIQALRAGKAVIVEKPMDVSIEACDRLIAVQKETGLPFAVISQHRFDPASLKTKQLLDQNAIGNLFLVEAQIKWHRTQEYYDSGNWRGAWDLDGGGALMNQGVHTVDLMRWMAGPVKSVYAVAKNAIHDRIEVEDVVCATLSFENGAIGNLVASTAVFPGFPATLSLHGSNGSIVISGDEIVMLETKNHVDAPVGAITPHALQVAQGGTKSAEQHKKSEASENAPSRWGDSHRAQLGDFIDAIRLGQTPKVDAFAGRNAVELVCAVYESARTGRVVNL